MYLKYSKLWPIQFSKNVMISNSTTRTVPRITSRDCGIQSLSLCCAHTLSSASPSLCVVLTLSLPPAAMRTPSRNGRAKPSPQKQGKAPAKPSPEKQGKGKEKMKSPRSINKIPQLGRDEKRTPNTRASKERGSETQSEFTSSLFVDADRSTTKSKGEFWFSCVACAIHWFKCCVSYMSSGVAGRNLHVCCSITKYHVSM